jgi:hypothetical protein
MLKNIEDLVPNLILECSLSDTSKKKRAFDEVVRMLTIRQDIYDEMLTLAGKIRILINTKYQEFSETNKPIIEEFQEKFPPVEPSNPHVQPEKIKAKRGRKPKRLVCEASNLMLLAEQAEALRKDTKIKLIPKLKRKESIFKPVVKKTRKRRQSKKSKPETEPESDDNLSDSEKVADQEPDDNEPVYCTCSKVSYGLMIECENESCPIEWFHFKCVGLKTEPKGKW